MTGSPSILPEPTAIRPGGDAQSGRPEPVKILIVDDLPEKCLVYRTVLEELGAEIVEAASGADALKRILKTDFAVILLDVNMPDMDGFETARMIRSRRRSAHTPIIFLTAFADEVKIAQGYATGAVDYLPTPVVPEILRAKVRVFIDLFRMRQHLARQAEDQARRSAAEELARRSTFLANASHALANSLDRDATIRALLRLPLVHLSDCCAVTLADEAGRAGRTHHARIDPDGIVHFGEAASPGAIEPWLARLIDRALEFRKLEMLLRLHAPSSLLPDIDGTGTYDSVIVIPLVARGKVLGAYTLALREGAGPWDPANIDLAQDLAGRAGIALENATLIRDIQENDRRKNEFLATLAHELRNPLAPIRNALETIRISGDDRHVVERSRPMMERQVNQLVRLVDDLLDVSRINRNVLELRKGRVALAEIVERALETSRPLIESSGHVLHVQLPPSSPALEADAPRLAQVISNLLNNAAKYTEPGGTIWLTAEAGPDEVAIRVRDNGFGIPASAMPGLFELFSQVELHRDRTQGGMGIGLNLVRKIVEMHGGRVEVSSDGPGLGSEFIVRIPGAEVRDAPGPRPNEPEPRAATPAKRRILVVDDNVDSAQSLGWILGFQGHNVRTAHDGFAALAIVSEFRPEVVLLDIGMPKMDGYETARRIRGETGGEKIVLIAQTGWGKDEDRKVSREAGFDHHLVKPVDPAALHAILVGPAKEIASR